MKAKFYAEPTQFYQPGEILRMADQVILNFIKKTNPNPLLKAYVIVHEGQATPSIDGKAGKINFDRKTVQAVYDKIGLGVGVYMDHDDDSEDRKVYGTVVGKDIRDIQGKRSAMVILAFDKKSEKIAEEHNYVSMEIEITMSANNEIENVLSFDGVALVPKGDRPALENARAVGTVRAKQHKRKGYFMSENLNNWHEVEAAFRQMRGLASQVTKPIDMIGELKFDQDGKPLLTGMDKEYVSYVQSLIEQGISKKLEKSNPDIDKIKNENLQLQKKLKVYESKPMLLEKAKAAKLGDDFVKFVEKRMDRFKPNEDDIETSINEFIEDKKLDYRDMKSLQSPGAGATTTPDTAEIDYDDPKQNPLLEG
jgi:hypothetical protein